MKIVADQNIPLLHEFFADIGNVVSLPGREITRNDLVDCSILIVRSITPVNQALLDGTPVKFVGTCTIGVDHIDTDYLDQQGIIWANAPGCNANAVVQYVFSAMAALMPDWQHKTIGIIGCGSIGKRLHRRFKQLDVKVKCHDPFLNSTQQDDLVSFEEVLNSDVISCHTPLTKTGEHPTYHLLNKHAYQKIPAGSLIINSCRGGVLDEQALLEIQPEKQFKLAIDVWENEPELNFTFLDKVQIATPHIAGYTLEGRENGTSMVYQALVQFLGIQGQDINTVVTNDVVPWQATTRDDMSREEYLNSVLLSCYPMYDDDESLRKGKENRAPEQTFGQYFDHLRKNYPHRREYTHYDFPLWQDMPELTRKINIIRNG